MILASLSNLNDSVTLSKLWLAPGVICVCQKEGMGMGSLTDCPAQVLNTAEQCGRSCSLPGWGGGITLLWCSN